MTLIEYSRIMKHSDRSRRGRLRAAMTPCSPQDHASCRDLPRTIEYALFYMSTISYTPRFPYQFKMTLIEYSRIPKHSECSRPRRLGAPTTACSPQDHAETCRELPNTLCFSHIIEFIVSTVFSYPASMNLSK